MAGHPIGKLVALFISFFMCSVALAEITDVQGRQVSIRLNGKTVSNGETLDVVDAGGKSRAVVKVTSFNETMAQAEVQSGSVVVGLKVARQKPVAAENSFNLRVNPIGLIAGGVAANLDYKIGRDWSVGLQALYLHVSLSPSEMYTSDFDITAYGLGTRANWFTNGAFKDGFYLGPSIEYLAVRIKTSDAYGTASGSAAGMMAAGLVGYGWFWQTFNIMIGGGYGSVFGASGITIKDSVGKQDTITAELSGFTYEFSFGFAF